MKGGDGTWTGTIILNDCLSDLMYSLWFIDTSGNVNTSELQTVSVIDNDDPILDDDLSPSSGTTGDEYTINITVLDNIGISSINVTWSHGKLRDNQPLTQNVDGSWSLTVTLGHNLISLVYSIQINDTSGNFHRCLKRTVPVLDNDKPRIDTDDSPDSGTTGDSYTFDLAVSDNINVSSVNATWSHGSLGGIAALDADGDDTWSLTIYLDDSLQDLTYSIQVNDSSGNYNRWGVQIVSVSDNDPANFGPDGTPSTATTGDPVLFEINASDNIGISRVFVEYWYGESVVMNPKTLNLSGTGPFSKSVTVENRLDVLNYRFTVEDTSGNTRTTPRVEIVIADDDPPVIGIDTTPDTASLTGSVVFTTEMTDNIDLLNVTVEYWYGNGTRANGTPHNTAVLHPEAENSDIHVSKSIAVDEGATGDLFYRFWAVDSSGNEQTTDNKMINITELHVDTDGDGTIDYRDDDDDGDEMSDVWEKAHGLDPLDSSDAGNDDDGDGLSNIREWELDTRPDSNDTDNDGMPDGWEVNFSCNPRVNDAGSDPDGDNLPNMDEYRVGTDPHNEDSDGDGVSDGEEIAKGSNPIDSKSKPKSEGEEDLFKIFGFGIGWQDITGALGSVLSFTLGFLLLTRKRRLYKRYIARMNKIEDWDELRELYVSEVLPRIEKEKFTPHHSVLLKDAYDECRAVLQKDSDRRESLKNYRKALRKALSDGVISDDEGSMLEDLREMLGITDDEHEDMVGKLEGSGPGEDDGMDAVSGDHGEESGAGEGDVVGSAEGHEDVPMIRDSEDDVGLEGVPDALDEAPDEMPDEPGEDVVLETGVREPEESMDTEPYEDEISENVGTDDISGISQEPTSPESDTAEEPVEPDEDEDFSNDVDTATDNDFDDTDGPVMDDVDGEVEDMPPPPL